MAFQGIKVLKDTYRDSVELMQVASGLERSFKGVRASVMMATPAFQELLSKSGVDLPAELAANDLIMHVKADSADVLNAALEKGVKLITEEKAVSPEDQIDAPKPSTIAEGSSIQGGSNLVLISVPGQYATAEAMKALKRGAHVFMFSDNVPLEDEIELKHFANERQLLLMGPDCGTALIDEVPLGFANVIRRGSIGLVGASGTGLQQVSSLIDTYGQGVSQMIGVGGRDLEDEVGGTMMLQGMQRLIHDPATNVIVLVSKIPGSQVTGKIYELVKSSPKPVVVNFLGCDAQPILASGGIYAETLEDAALLAVSLIEGKPRARNAHLAVATPRAGHVRGLYSGGTLCKEAKLIFKQTLGSEAKKHSLIDYGESEYTVGKAHPMIDFSTRNEELVKAAADPNTSVVLFDIVLGYGANMDPVGQLAPALTEAVEMRKQQNRPITFIASVCGTATDPQGMHKQAEMLAQLGVILTSSNAEAARLALFVATGKKSTPAALSLANVKSPRPAVASNPLLKGIKALNIGLKHFSEPISKSGGQVLQLEWKPPAEGHREHGLSMARLEDDSAGVGQMIKQANDQALQRLQKGLPVWTGVALAKEVIPGMGERMILHSGPPVTWTKMCGPMKGAVIGAILYEGWAKTVEEAEKLAALEINFSPCNDHNAVGPMAGIISPTMPVAIIENKTFGNKAFATFNEGLGRRLRFGAYDEGVMERLRWIKTVLAPALQQTIAANPIQLKTLLAQALQMGDECHNRNTAATSLLTRQLGPMLMNSVRDTAQVYSILEFLRDNDHFFLNLSMACSKSMLQASADIDGSSLVTIMSRNGVEFGIQMSGTGKQWFTAPSPVVDGLYFPGRTKADANPDLGDSSITETAGFGGFAMAASPAIVRFVGGTAQSAVQHTLRMYKITLGKNPDYAIPGLNFGGIPQGIDARRVVDSAIPPVINTGIAHKEPGIGQVGAGIALAPLSPFATALGALSSKLLHKSKERKGTRAYSTASTRRMPFTVVRRTQPSSVLRVLKCVVKLIK